MGGDALVEEIENAAALLGAGGDDAPHTLVVTLTDVATSALRDAAVDHAVANLLLAVVVGRLKKIRHAHETEIVFGLVVWLQVTIVIFVVDERATIETIAWFASKVARPSESPVCSNASAKIGCRGLGVPNKTEAGCCCATRTSSSPKSSRR